MRNFKNVILPLVLLICGLSSAQETPKINIPNILGYKTLKCDFHLHTVFSDGQVWPTVRVEEAWRDGLDAISITDHIEYRPFPKYFSKEEGVILDHNTSYEVANEQAIKRNIILIKGAEITRTMPPGHCNALFLTDINPLDTPWEEDEIPKQGWIETGMLINNWKDAFYKAKNQGSLIFWNHPGWERQQPDTILWWQEHTWLLENHMLSGIEVVNGRSYSPEAHQWALDKNLTIVAGSDNHGPVGGSLRSITLVFAMDNSINSIKEALIEHRSAVFYENKLIGARKFLDAIFWSSINVESVERTEEGFRIIIHNPTSIPFELSKMGGNDPKLQFSDKISILAGKYTTIQIYTAIPDTFKRIDLKLSVDNLLIVPGIGLPVIIPFIVNN